MADDVVEEAPVENGVQVAIGVRDAGLVDQRRADPFAVRPDHAGDAVVGALGDLEREPEFGRDLRCPVLGGAEREDLPLVRVGSDVEKQLLARVTGTGDGGGGEVGDVDPLALREQA